MQRQFRIQALLGNYFVENFPEGTNRRQFPEWPTLVRHLSADFGLTQESLNRAKAELDKNTVVLLSA
jgi:hypothetical protein